MLGQKKMGDGSFVVVATTDGGEEVLVRLTTKCHKRIATAAGCAAEGGGLWIVIPPTPGSTVMWKDQVVDVDQFVVSPCLNLSVVCKKGAWVTIPTLVCPGGTSCPQDL